MPRITQGQSITTRESSILIEQLKPGRYRFQLVVIDNDGQPSAPAVAVVEVVDPNAPRPPLTPRTRRRTGGNG